MKKKPVQKVQTIFGANLSTWRRDNGLRLKDVAAGVGVSPSIVCEWEHGNRFPSARHLDAVAAFVGVPVWKFLKP